VAEPETQETTVAAGSDRTPRASRTRVRQPLRAQYVPPSTLPEPLPRNGLVHRWIATHVMGHSEPANVSLRMREGWEPVKASDYPELGVSASAGGNVEIGGLMLCSMPTEYAVQREEYYANVARQQMQSVDNNFLRNNDPRMPLFSDKKSEVARGRGFGNGTK
jgi:hypothetical protein